MLKTVFAEKATNTAILISLHVPSMIIFKDARMKPQGVKSDDP